MTWLRTYRDEIAVTLACVLLIASLAWAAHAGKQAAHTNLVDARIEELTEQRNRYRDAVLAMHGARLWAHEYETGAIVFAEWRFDSRAEADEFLRHVGGLIDD